MHLIDTKFCGISYTWKGGAENPNQPRAKICTTWLIERNQSGPAILNRYDVPFHFLAKE